MNPTGEQKAIVWSDVPEGYLWVRCHSESTCNDSSMTGSRKGVVHRASHESTLPDLVDATVTKMRDGGAVGLEEDSGESSPNATEVRVRCDAAAPGLLGGQVLRRETARIRTVRLSAVRA